MFTYVQVDGFSFKDDTFENEYMSFNQSRNATPDYDMFLNP